MAPRSPLKESASPKKPPSQKKASQKESKPVGGDIRSFFSQGSNGGPSKPANGAKSGSGKMPISIDDSDEEPEPVETKPKATTSKHFPPPAASSSKKPIVLDDTPEPDLPRKATPAAASKKQTPQSSAKKASVAKRKVLDSSDEEDVKPKKRQSLGGRSTKKNYAESSEDDEEEDVKPKRKAKAKKEPSPMDIDDDEDEDDEDDFIDDDEDDDRPKKSKAKVKPKAPSRVKSTPKSTPKKEDKPPPKKATPKKQPPPPKKPDVKDELEEPAQPEKKPKFDWKAAAARKQAGPAAPGSKEIPEGAPDCLAGLTFVFTGELESLGRDEAIDLAKRYSGKVTSAPSGKTSFVVVGAGAGESKLKAIKEKGLKTLDEDGFLNLIRSREGAELDEKQIKALEKEQKKIEEAAKEMEAREKEEEKLAKRKEAAMSGTGLAVKKLAPMSAQLWTTKYAPQNLKDLCGNKGQVQKLLTWLQEWEKNYNFGFKRPGKDGMGMYRAVLVSGPPGIGKTTSAHLMAKEAGYNPLELNASDARSKKLIEHHTNIDNASLDGFFQGSGLKSQAAAGINVNSRTCLIMDEVDGMSAGDRGGVGALNALIKKTKIPMILICNDRTLQKMKPLMSTTYNMTFKRLQPAEVRSRLMSILYKEKLKIPANVLDELVKGANSDIRQVLNMLATYKLGKRAEMDFDTGKEILKVNEKNTIMTPFTIIDKLTGPYAFSASNRETLNDKAELYFHDFSFVPLFMQEHYLKTQPARAAKEEGPMRDLKHLELVVKAADSISDGDLIDRMIHGSEQHWSLLPVHAFASTVTPASLIYGPSRSQNGGWGGPSFPQWLGQNSKQGKLGRQLTDIQIRMRLRVSGSRHEIREQYMPMLATRLVRPLMDHGSDAVEEVIEYMDDYFLGKEDWDAFVELGVDNMKDELVLKKIPTAVKTAFTRQYNKADHPIAFHKGDMFAAAKKKIPDMGPAPDNEDVFEEDEPVPDEESDKADNDDEEVNDVGKDKLIKAVKPKGAAAKTKKK